MNRYWDLTPQQRAKLPRDQVVALLDVELMEKGVAKVQPPTLIQVLDMKLPCEECFEVQFDGSYGSQESSGFVFASSAQAKAFIDAKPTKRTSDYQFGNVPYAKPCTGGKIVPTELPTQQAVISMAVKLAEVEEAKKANRTATQEYDKAQTAVKEALSGLWEDWHTQRETEHAALEVQRTRDEYVGICDGDKEKAETFLRKVFDADRIRRADGWLDNQF